MTDRRAPAGLAPAHPRQARAARDPRAQGAAGAGRRPRRASRSPSSAWASASRAACATRRASGGCSSRARTPSPRSRPSAGPSTPSTPRPRRAREDDHAPRRLRRRRRPLRRRVLRHLAARGGEHGPAAAPAARGGLGGAGGRRPARPARSPAARAGVFVGICNSDYGRALFADREAHRRLLQPPATPPAWPRGASPTCSACTGRAWRSTPRARRRWWRCTWPARACAGASATWRWPAASTSSSRPEMNIDFSKARHDGAPTAAARPSTPRADGYVRGEGCGVVVLKRLSRRAGRRRPHPGGDPRQRRQPGRAQRRPHRAERAGAGGGDPRRAGGGRRAAGADRLRRGARHRHAARRPDRGAGAGRGARRRARRRATRSLVGSVKTNIGHLEAAAGVAGLIKVVLALQRREIPPHLHLQHRQPAHRLGGAGRSRCRRRRRPGPRRPTGRRLAGVSSFGFSGTNAHVILEEAPAAGAPGPSAPDRPLHLLALSARDEAALAELAAAYQHRLAAGPDDARRPVLHGRRRARRTSRTGWRWCGGSAEALRRGLAAHARGEASPAVAAGRVDGAARPQVAFLFTGQGAQSPGMGRALYETAPVFRAALDACAAGLAPHARSAALLEVMFAAPEASPIDETAYAQPAIFALEVALAALWRSWGIEPAAVIGHSLGEYAAACVAGVLSLEDGLRLVAERGRLDAAPCPRRRDGGGLRARGAGRRRRSPRCQRRGVHRGRQRARARRGERPARRRWRRSRAGCEAAGRAREAAARVPRRPLAAGRAGAARASSARSPAVALRASRALALVSNLTGAVAGPGEDRPRVDYWLRPPAPAGALRAVDAGAGGAGHHPLRRDRPAPGAARAWAPSACRAGGPRVAALAAPRTATTGPMLLESLQRLYVRRRRGRLGGLRPRPRAGAACRLPTYPVPQRKRHWAELVGQRRPRRPRRRAPSAGRGSTAALDRAGRARPARPRRCVATRRSGRSSSASPRRTRCAVLREAGLFLRAGERRTVRRGARRGRDRADATGTCSRRWLERLAAPGPAGGGGRGLRRRARRSPEPGLPALWAEAERLLADNRPLLAYVRHCGDARSARCSPAREPARDALPGRLVRAGRGPLRALGHDALRQRRSPRRPSRRWRPRTPARRAAARARGRRRHRRHHRRAAARSCRPSARRYRFTDVSDALPRPRPRALRGVPLRGVRPARPRPGAATQGSVAPGSFDLVVAANAVHASRDLRAALAPPAPPARARRPAAAGRVHGAPRLVRHDHRPDRGLAALRRRPARATTRCSRPRAGWRRCGRPASRTRRPGPRPGSAAEALGQHVILARAPGELAAAVRGELAQPEAAVDGEHAPALATARRRAGRRRRAARAGARGRARTSASSSCATSCASASCGCCAWTRASRRPATTA